MAEATEYDAIIVGAGFGGLRTLHELRDEQGLNVRVIEAGTDVGGTWYWNRYPGARTDSEAWVYCFSFDDELKQEYDFTERFSRQPQVLAYLQHCADRFDWRKDIQFETRVDSAVYDEDTERWTVTTNSGEQFVCQYFVPASGILSVTYDPPFPGLETFKGEWYQTSRWPKDPVSFEGKRVAVVGAGATAVQVIPVVADQAEHLTVFQRTPNYVMPSRNHPLDDVQRAYIKRNYEAIWDQAHRQVFAFPMDPAGRMWTDSTPEEREFALKAAWEAGGFRYLFESFDDLLIDEECNDRASEFVREQIRSIVKDPETADKLSPTTYPVGGKRPPLGHFYYETFNRSNVSLHDCIAEPITEITEKGLIAGGVEHEFDILIFAMGFDAVTGALTHMDVRGKGGVTIAEKWEEGAENYLGLSDPDFPNMFMILGPQSAFANLPPVIHHQAEWLGRLITHMREQGFDTATAEREVTDAWCDECEMLLNATLLRRGVEGNAWFLGANIPGKKANVLFYFGGAGAYFDVLKKSAADGFPGFAFAKGRALAAS